MADSAVANSKRARPNRHDAGGRQGPESGSAAHGWAGSANWRIGCIHASRARGHGGPGGSARSAAAATPGRSAAGAPRSTRPRPSRARLYQIAQRLDIPGRSTMSREELLEAVRVADPSALS